MKTTTFAHRETFTPKWVHISAKDVVLGRLAARVAQILMGKHRPTYTPFTDTGDFVVITDAECVALTGKKADTKVYRHHTGYVGSLRERPFKDVLAHKPAEPIELAVRRMLPKTKLGRTMFSKLKVYAGKDHPHQAQRPETITI